MSFSVSNSLVPLKRRLPGRQLEQHDPHGEDVAARVDDLAASLLGRHVRDLALQLPALRLHRRLRVALGDAEIDDLHVAREGHDDVLRRDVAMDDVERRAVEIALLVGVGEAARDPEHDRDGVLEGELDDPLLLHLPHDAPQVLAVHVLHRDVVRAVDLPHVEDLHDVRVRQRRRDRGLVEQHLDERAVVVHRREDALDDDELLEAGDALLDGQEELAPCRRRKLAQQRVLAEPARQPFACRVAVAGGGRPCGKLAFTSDLPARDVARRSHVGHTPASGVFPATCVDTQYSSSASSNAFSSLFRGPGRVNERMEQSTPHGQRTEQVTARDEQAGMAGETCHVVPVAASPSPPLRVQVWDKGRLPLHRGRSWIPACRAV